jgi:hypothetical protein
MWKWMQKYKPERIFYNRMKISKFIVDETQRKYRKRSCLHGIIIDLDKLLIETSQNLRYNSKINTTSFIEEQIYDLLDNDNNEYHNNN